MSPALQWAIIGLLCLGLTIACFGRVSLSVALTADGFKNEFRLGNPGCGLLLSAFFWSNAALRVTVGWFADRLIARGDNPVKVRKTFVIAGFPLAVNGVIRAVSHSASEALFCAVFSLSGLGPVMDNHWAPTQTLMPGAAVGRIAGVQNCAASIPGVVAPILTGWLQQTAGSYEAPIHAIWIFLLLGVASYFFLVREKYVPR